MLFANIVNNVVNHVSSAVQNFVGKVGDLIEGKVGGSSNAGLSNTINNSPELSTNQSARASGGISAMSANEASFDGLPKGMTPAEYEKALEFAKLSSQTYDADDNAIVDVGFKLFKGIDHIKSQDFSTPNYKQVSSTGNDIDWWFGKDQGLDYDVFEHKETGDLVVAFRGTEPLSLEDWAENIEQAFGDSEQYEGAIAFAKELQAKLDAEGGGRQLSFTGHSLGGGLATAAALATGNEAIVFEAAGVSNGTIAKNDLDVGNAKNITNINVKGDWLSDWNGKQDNSTLGNGLLNSTHQYGDTVWLEGVNDQADFGGWLVPDWSAPAKLAESVLNHAWHVFTYQLENKNFA